MKAANLAVLASAYRRVGAQAMVVVGPVENAGELAAYTAALGSKRLSVHRLHADRDELTRRILSRHDRPSWPAPGDRLNGQPLEVLRRVAAEVTARGEASIGRRVDTTAKTVEQVADEVLDS